MNERQRAGRLVVLTGATGYIGTVLTRRLLAEGFRIRALSRSRPSGVDVEHIPYELRSEVPVGALDGAAAIIHLAAETQWNSDTYVEAELVALRRLMIAASQTRARFVFVSSQSASPDAPSNYGRAKWLCEQEVISKGGVVIRPGLVYGGAERGLFGTLCRFLRALPLLPRLTPAPLVQPVHVDDLAEAFVKVISDPSLESSVFSIAEPRPITLHAFLHAIATERLCRASLFIPVPLGLLLPLLEITSPIWGASASPDRLRTLVHSRLLDTRPTLERLALPLRRLEDGMSRSGQTCRKRLTEARTLLVYLLGSPVPASALIRYAKAIERLDASAPLLLPLWIRRFPMAMVLFDQPGIRAKSPNISFYRRLDIATVLAETIPTKASRFIATGGRTQMIGRLTGLGFRLVAEGVVRVAALALRPLLVKYLPSSA